MLRDGRRDNRKKEVKEGNLNRCENHSIFNAGLIENKKKEIES